MEGETLQYSRTNIPLGLIGPYKGITSWKSHQCSMLVISSLSNNTAKRSDNLLFCLFILSLTPSRSSITTLRLPHLGPQPKDNLWCLRVDTLIPHLLDTLPTCATASNHTLVPRVALTVFSAVLFCAAVIIQETKRLSIGVDSAKTGA